MLHLVGLACDERLGFTRAGAATCPRPGCVTGQNKKEGKAWNARCKKGDKELRAAGKQLDAARVHAANLGVGGGTGRPGGPEPAPPAPGVYMPVQCCLRKG